MNVGSGPIAKKSCSIYVGLIQRWRAQLQETKSNRTKLVTMIACISSLACFDPAEAPSWPWDGAILTTESAILTQGRRRPGPENNDEYINDKYHTQLPAAGATTQLPAASATTQLSAASATTQLRAASATTQ
jgi:hypothetical protein